MRRAQIATCAAVLMLAGCSGMSAEDVQEAAQQVKDGESLNVRKQYPEEGVQLYAFTAGRPIWRTDLWYIIDLRAHLCFSTLSRSETAVLTPVPCKALKAGYPLVAPLITWDDPPMTVPEARTGSASTPPSSASPAGVTPAQSRPAASPGGPGPAASPSPRPAGR